MFAYYILIYSFFSSNTQKKNSTSDIISPIVISPVKIQIVNGRGEAIIASFNNNLTITIHEFLENNGIEIFTLRYLHYDIS